MDFEKLVKEAAAEGLEMINGLCEPRGFLFWKSRAHKWGKWYREFERRNETSGVLGHNYERSCKCCGSVQRKYIAL